jgi:AcrR family transcriptional regulator
VAPASKTSNSSANFTQVAELTPRAQRTRSALMTAGRSIFERDGFHNARITDIAEEAGVAHGTFYTYFDSKETILLAIVDDLLDTLLNQREARQVEVGSDLTPYERLERTNRDYLSLYRDNGRIIAIWEDLAAFNEEASRRRDAGQREFMERSERQIRRLQAEGRADGELDPEYAAAALTAMVHRFAYNWFSAGGDYDLDKAVHNLTRLWANALRMDQLPSA